VDYEADFSHVPGRLNTVADLLSSFGSISSYYFYLLPSPHTWCPVAVPAGGAPTPLQWLLPFYSGFPSLVLYHTVAEYSWGEGYEWSNYIYLPNNLKGFFLLPVTFTSKAP
jgi:hypothetical protein